MKKRITFQEKIFAKSIFDKGLVSRIFLKLSTILRKKPIKKQAKGLKRQLTQEATWMANKYMRSSLLWVHCGCSGLW